MNSYQDKSLLHNELCEKLEINIPVFQAPMTGYATPELVAAVSETGGLGILPAGNLSPEQLYQKIKIIKNLTDRPFGINFLIAPPEPISEKISEVNSLMNNIRKELGLPEKEISTMLPPNDIFKKFEVALNEEIKIITFAMGDPAPFINYLKNEPVFCIPMVTTVDEAKYAAIVGADAVIAQGSDAGGHRSTFLNEKELPLIGTMSLVPQVADAVHIPVIAAGGIMDGRGLAAALMLGASAVQIGTRLLLSDECGTIKSFRERILKSTEEDTVLTKIYTGKTARSLKSKIINDYQKIDSANMGYPYQAIASSDIYGKAMIEDKAEYIPMYAGQGLRLANKELPACEILLEIEREANEAIEKLSLQLH